MNLTSTLVQNDLPTLKSKLSELKELYDSGLIDEDDFKIRKEKI